MRRRDFVGASAAFVSNSIGPLASAQSNVQRKGRLKQTVMTTVFDPKMPFDEMCRHAAELGLKGMDTVPVESWPTLKKYGLIPTMGPTGGVTFKDGIIRKELHDSLEKSMSATLDICAANECPNMIAVGGQRRGMSYEEGADNAVAMLNRVKHHAEDKGVTICLENMNSKYKDPAFGREDQICDHVAWGFEVCKRVNSPRVKLLFSIYHAQIMDGDICANIRDNFAWIAHFDTGGVPGRNQIDDTQEINYRFVAKTIADLGYTGYICHEYRPSPGSDPIRTLAKVLEIMDV
ncbi:MAG: TIM barrel protein [Acidobacteriia bacterium]|nr:TIM barrel protein [Terriglobia bacterium]